MGFSVFGGEGFVGREVCKDKDFVSLPRDRLDGEYPNLVILRSTIHNYHPYDGDFYTDIRTNLLHLMQIMEANRMKYGNDFHVTYVSTWFVYGSVHLPAREDACCHPNGFYSITKLAAEQLLASLCGTYGIPYNIVRLSNVLGVGDQKISKRRNALQYMIKTLCEGGTIDLYAGNTYRDYIYVSDAAEAIRCVATAGKPGEIYNAGSGIGTVIGDVIKYVDVLTNGRGHINLIEPPAFHKTVQVDEMWLDVEKIYQHTGWRAQRDVYDIVDELVEAYGPQ